MAVQQHHAEKPRSAHRASGAHLGGGGALFIAATMFSGAANATAVVDYAAIDAGFRLFTEETFGGNGRTCSVCHLPEVNYNIFPSTISNLKKAERDLVYATNVPGLENKKLVQRHALFNISGNESTHGADEPDEFGTAGHEGPIFRSSMAIQALEITSTNKNSSFPGTPLLLGTNCNDGVANELRQLGWSGDGSPGTPKPLTDTDCHFHHGTFDELADGSFFAFANGAIAQHNTKSLARVQSPDCTEGSDDCDFRFATQEEAEDLEAFQIWLGRRAVALDPDGTPAVDANGRPITSEFNIDEDDGEYLMFTDARVDLGRRHYVGPAECAGPFRGPDPCLGDDGLPLEEPEPDPDAGANCNGCHPNGGALSSVGGDPNDNSNINTEVELASEEIGLHVVNSVLPHDEGGSDSFGGATLRFDEAFNVQSIIEAARKDGWFHNHKVIGDFEEAIAHYISHDFLCGPEEDDDLETCDNAPVARTTEPVMKYGNAVLEDDATTNLISFPTGGGIKHLGGFLRALSAWYSLRDCERLVQETLDRIAVEVSPDLPAMHCEFNLSDVIRVLEGSKLRPLPYQSLLVPQGVPSLLDELKEAVEEEDTDRLEDILDTLAEMRGQIATISPPPT